MAPANRARRQQILSDVHVFIVEAVSVFSLLRDFFKIYALMQPHPRPFQLPYEISMVYNLSGKELPKCQQEYQEKNRQWYLEGRSIPWCKDDGRYQRLQCFRSYCYCVTMQDGVELFRSRMEISRGDAVCPTEGTAVEYFEPFMNCSSDILVIL